MHKVAGICKRMEPALYGRRRALCSREHTCTYTCTNSCQAIRGCIKAQYALTKSALIKSTAFCLFIILVSLPQYCTVVCVTLFVVHSTRTTDRVHRQRDENGITDARKAIILCGLALNNTNRQTLGRATNNSQIAVDYPSSSPAL